MSDYIKREDAEKIVNDFLNDNIKNFPVTANSVVHILTDIHYLPAADVRENVRGEWITPTIISGKAFTVPHCSVCNGVPCGVDENTNFCPNCGADMKEAKCSNAKIQGGPENGSKTHG